MAARGTFFGREGVQLKGHVETNGVVNVALFAINNDYITYVDPATGFPTAASRPFAKPRVPRRRSLTFNQPAGVAAIPAKSTTAISGIYDVLSAIYRVARSL